MRKRPDIPRGSDRLRFREGAKRAAIGAVIFMALQLAVACSRAPTFNILGSFFPSWILCGLLGIVLTVAVRLLLVRVGLEQYLFSLVVVYPCLTLFFTFTIWLLFFS
jgi:hypothetical protein